MMSGYDENEIGALDCDEIEGTIATDSAVVMQCADEFARRKAFTLEEATLKLARQQNSDDDDMIDLKVDARTREKWDCESVLSTYSNIYNHPKLIPREQSDNKVKSHFLFLRQQYSALALKKNCLLCSSALFCSCCLLAYSFHL